MDNVEANRIITAILGTVENLIRANVDHGNNEFLIELQRLVGAMFERADHCLRNGLNWDQGLSMGEEHTEGPTSPEPGYYLH